MQHTIEPIRHDENQSNGGRSDSQASLRSVNSIRSQRYVKLRVKNIKPSTEKEEEIAVLQQQNERKDEQILRMMQEIEMLRSQIN